MSTITKEQAQKIIEAADEVITALAGTNEDVHPESDSMLRLWDDLNDRYAPPEVVRELARIALASLKAEPVADVVAWSSPNEERTCDVRLRRHDINPGQLYTAPPALASVPDNIDARMKNAGMLSATEIIAGQPIDAFMKHAGVVDLASLLKWAEMRRAEFLRMQAKYVLGDNPKDDMYEWVISHVAAFSELHVNIRAAMLQGADTELQRKAAIHDALCEKYNVESLADFVDWQRNHIAELEAVPPAPVGEGENAVMPDYPGYTMTQRECFQAGKEAGLAEAGSSPVITDELIRRIAFNLVYLASDEMVRSDQDALNALVRIGVDEVRKELAAPQQEV